MYWRLIVLLAFGLPSFLLAQSSNLSVRLANLEQDMRALQHTVGSLRLELEAMSRENAQLRSQIQQELTNSRRDLVTIDHMNRRLAALSTDVQNSLTKTQEQTLAEVASRMETLAKQTQDAIKAITKAMGDAPTAPVSFSDNYPKTGVSYTVQPGDSLGKIARENNSTIDWIRNANRIAGDLIRVGDQLFIPQRN